MSMKFDGRCMSEMESRTSRSSMTNVGLRLLWVASLFAISSLPVFAGDARQTPLSADRTIAIDHYDACVIGNDGALACSGADRDGIDVPPAGKFVSTAASFGHRCALGSDGEIACWGSVPALQLPRGPWRSLAMGGWNSACGIRPDGRLQCWGSALSFIGTQPIDGRYRAVSVGDAHACAIRDDGTLRCWSDPWTFAPLGTPPVGRFVRVDVNFLHACALRADGGIECWGWNRYGQTDAPSGTGFADVAVGEVHSCAIRSDSAVQCWGGNQEGQTVVPQGRFTELDAQDSSTCARRVDGQLACWGGYSSNPLLRGPLRVPLEHIDIGASGGICALDREGNPQCADDDEPLLPVPGRYLDLGLGSGGGCGVKRDGGVVCWGDSPAPPAGTDGEMVAISAGEAHVCALRKTGDLMCWGEDRSGSTQPPSGMFTQLASGRNFSCALRDDGAIACWGEGEAVAEAPRGTGHSDLAADGGSACAIDAQARIRCWGNDASWLRSLEYHLAQEVEIGAHFGCFLGMGSIQCIGDYEKGEPSFPWDETYISLVARGARCAP